MKARPSPVRSVTRGEMSRWCRAAAIAAALPLGGCADSLAPSLIAGDWAGRDVPSHFASIEIRLEQDGNRISGKACRVDGDNLGFTDIPVVIDGRRLTFSVPVGSSRKTFKGEFDGSPPTAIRGAWSDSPTTRVTLQRGGSYCANTRR